MAEFIGEGLEELADRIAQLSERQAVNARILLEEIQRRRSEAASRAATSLPPPEPRSWTICLVRAAHLSRPFRGAQLPHLERSI